MATLLNESLETLSRLSPRKLHHVSRVHRATLGSAEWHLALCLLAAVHTMAYRTLGYSNITEYAERGLNLSGRKAGALLSAARALEVRRAIERGGFGDRRLAVKALADTEPLPKEGTSTIEEERRKNRRVVIRVY